MKKKIALVLLAAGDSRRFGSNKLLSDFAGMPMYRRLTGQVALLGEGYFEQKILVTQYQEIAADLGQQGYQVVMNTQSSLGISHSIHLALAQLAPQVEAACFAVCDQPWLRAETISALINVWTDSGKGMGCLCYQDRLGNPAVFSRTYFTALSELSGDTGGKQILKRRMEDVCLYSVENEKELLDIDKNTCLTDSDSL